MRILHLSDLHLTGQFQNFEEIWSGPSPHLAPGSFDFVVVSGDLSQRAEPSEYEQLYAFLERSVLPLLKVRQRQRVVLVPGNHDVDWTADIGDRLSIEEELSKNSNFGDLLRRAAFEPEKSLLRVSIGRYGHLDVLRIDPSRYPSRFEHVQRFLSRFYEGSLPPEAFRPFVLTTADDAEHWSAHVFPDSGIAFYGFSSCSRNDRHWTGAMLNAKAIERARLHAEAHARDCIRIAIWHHGFGSDRGRPDYLSTQDIGLLYNAGFRLGFHGHTHQAAYKTFEELFKERFFVVSTGSLGAGSEERPDAIGNQFSIAHVYPGHIDVEVFNRHNSGSYEKNQERRRHTFLEPTIARLDQLSHAVRHRRTWTVDSDGIAKVEIEMEDVTLRGEVTLALIEKPFCSVLAQEKADTSTGPMTVERKDLPDERIRFTLSAAQEVRLDHLRWSYRISNCLALNQMDLQARKESHSSLEHLHSGLDGRPYTVRFPCDELTLTLRFPDLVRMNPNAESRQVVALRRAEERGQERWINSPLEIKRGRLDGSANHVQFTIPSPLVGHRYLVACEPADTGRPHDVGISQLLSWLMEECRDKPPTPGSLPVALTQNFDRELSHLLGSSPGRDSSWMCYLWHPGRHKLMTALGMFPNRAWAVRFSWGEGVAGHALRFGQETGWVRGDSSHRSLIFKSNPGASPEGDYSWIVCIPILTSIRNPVAIGVLGFAGNSRGGPAEQQLREYAQYIARTGNQPFTDEGYIDFRNRLFSVVHSAFWQSLRSWKEHTPRREALVRLICDELGLPSPPVEAPAIPRPPL
ncbi:MAG TPA: metallophosphoesterase [Myxococcaceae bacterium]|nr:metallophosphoesterase [Myxococcaceae bacterium]